MEKEREIEMVIMIEMVKLKEKLMGKVTGLKKEITIEMVKLMVKY